jgi:hypothetical protein
MADLTKLRRTYTLWSNLVGARLPAGYQIGSLETRAKEDLTAWRIILRCFSEEPTKSRVYMSLSEQESIQPRHVVDLHCYKTPSGDDMGHLLDN